VNEFRCYDNTHVCKLIAVYTANAYSAEREMSASVCTRSMASFVFAAAAITPCGRLPGWELTC